MKLKRTSIKLDPDLWRRAKHYAARSPMTASELVEATLREYMTNHPKDEKADKQTV